MNSKELMQGLGESIKNLLVTNMNSASPQPIKQGSLLSLGKKSKDLYVEKHMSSLKQDIKKVKMW